MTKEENALTHYQTTNFRLFQTERVCRRQFQILQKWKKVIQTGRKHCGKRRNCLLRAISPFPTVFSKGLFPRGVKRCLCVGMVSFVTIFVQLYSHINDLEKKSSWKRGKIRKWYTAFSPFPTIPFPKTISIFQSQFFVIFKCFEFGLVWNFVVW